VRCEDSHCVLDDDSSVLASVGNHLPGDTKARLMIAVLHKFARDHLGLMGERCRYCKIVEVNFREVEPYAWLPLITDQGVKSLEFEISSLTQHVVLCLTSVQGITNHINIIFHP
jgi:hypothetical protein